MLETTLGSPLHWPARFDGSNVPIFAAVYLACVAVTYLPLLLIASMTGSGSDNAALPFRSDLNIAFTFLVSFPMLVLLIVTDENVLARSLERVWASGVLSTPVREGTAFTLKWAARFRWANTLSGLLGLSLGALLSWYTLRAYISADARFWAAPAGRIGLIGSAYVYCIALLYAVIAIFVTRSVAIALFLSDLVNRLDLHLLPFHPDGCGGLQSVGRLGLRNQYTLTVLGINIAILGFVTVRYLAPRGADLDLIVVAILAYCVLGPLVFMAPLLPFRAGMLRSKGRLMGELGERLRIDFTAIRNKLPNEGLTVADVEALERLKKMGAMIQELPIWPFDSRTLKVFASAYAVPLVLLLSKEFVERLLTWLGQRV